MWTVGCVKKCDDVKPGDQILYNYPPKGKVTSDGDVTDVTY